MGLPIYAIIVATNENDILHRFFSTGRYEQSFVIPTLAPAMDIQVASNFERFLFDLSGRDPEKLNNWMTRFDQTKQFVVNASLLKTAQSNFISTSLGQSCVKELSFLEFLDYIDYQKILH